MPSIRAAASASLLLAVAALLRPAARAHEGYHPGFDQIPPGLNEVDVKDETATTFFVVTRQVKEADIGTFAAEAVGPLMLELRRQQLDVMGPLTFIYRGRGGDGETFTMDIGVPVVEAKGAAPDGYAYRKEPDFTCVSGVYKGAMAGLNQAWGRVRETAGTRQRTASGQEREVYLHWVDPESVNNVIDLQHGVR